jgi:1-acyl-sn-glycerol-3-phosphate acyltransferase
MRARSAATGLAKDLAPAQLLRRYHRRTRRRAPWLQTLALRLLLPLLSLVSRVRVVGRENIPNGGYIAASNHASILDALFVALAIRRRIRFMGKSELFDGRWGWLLNRLGAFPVQRGVWDADALELRSRCYAGRDREGQVRPRPAPPAFYDVPRLTRVASRDTSTRYSTQCVAGLGTMGYSLNGTPHT